MEEKRSIMNLLGKAPVISIITPVYNGEEYIEELILSILEQDYPFVEHIIIDDGSDDNAATVSILKKYPHLRWWSRDNKGQYATLNEGVAAAKGDVINIICADDKYANPTVLSTVISFWQKHLDCGCIYGITFHMNDKSEKISVYPDLKKPPYPAWFLRYQMVIPHCSLFVNKSVITNNDIKFDLSFKYAGDWDWLIQLTQSTKFAYLKQPLSVYRQHEKQHSLLIQKQVLFLEKRRILERYKASYTLYWLQVYQFRIKKIIWILRKKGIKSLFSTIKYFLIRKYNIKSQSE